MRRELYSSASSTAPHFMNASSKYQFMFLSYLEPKLSDVWVGTVDSFNMQGKSFASHFIINLYH